MAAEPLNESDLTALSDAINDYKDSWKPVDLELYDLCRRRPCHDDLADVYTKVAVVGRVYTAGVARAWGRKDYPPDSEIAQVRKKLPERGVTDLLNENAGRIQNGWTASRVTSSARR